MPPKASSHAVPVVDAQCCFTAHRVHLLVLERPAKRLPTVCDRVVVHPSGHASEPQSFHDMVDLFAYAFPELTVLQDVDDGLQERRWLYCGGARCLDGIC